MTIDVRDVSRALRAEVWPAVKRLGFQFRTDRAAWRYLDDAVDVIDVQSVGAGSDAVGCTTFSFSARAGTLPTFIEAGFRGALRGIPATIPKARPHYWDTRLQFGLEKTLSQPWFEPFAHPPKATVPEAMLVHRAGLMSVNRRDRHDRPDIWFVREDGSNLDEVIADLRDVVVTRAVPLLHRMHDPCELIGLLEAGQIVKPDSPIGLDLLRRAREACRS